MLAEFAQAYSEVFAPELFVLFCAVLLILYEWRGLSDATIQGLAARLSILGLGWIVAFAIYQGVPRVVGTLPEWGTDMTGSAGLGVGILVIWLWWRVHDWGDLVPGFTLLLIAVTIPHLLITPFWAVSSHVLYTVAPAGHRALVDRRFVPLSLLPVGMVVARPLAEEHTWAQSIGGFLLGLALLVVLSRVSASPDEDSRSGKNTSFHTFR